MIWDGIRILNRHYRVEAFVEAGPDTICGTCGGWGRGEHSCAPPKHPRCALYADEYYCLNMIAKRQLQGKPRRSLQPLP